MSELSIFPPRWASRFGVWRCRKAATIAEYGIAAGLAVTAWGAVDSPRFQTVKDPTACVAHVKRGLVHRWDRPAPARTPRNCAVKPSTDS